MVEKRWTVGVRKLVFDLEDEEKTAEKEGDGKQKFCSTLPPWFGQSSRPPTTDRSKDVPPNKVVLSLGSVAVRSYSYMKIALDGLWDALWSEEMARLETKGVSEVAREKFELSLNFKVKHGLEFVSLFLVVVPNDPSGETRVYFVKKSAMSKFSTRGALSMLDDPRKSKECLDLRKKSGVLHQSKRYPILELSDWYVSERVASIAKFKPSGVVETKGDVIFGIEHDHDQKAPPEECVYAGVGDEKRSFAVERLLICASKKTPLGVAWILPEPKFKRRFRFQEVFRFGSRQVRIPGFVLEMRDQFGGFHGRSGIHLRFGKIRSVGIRFQKSREDLKLVDGDPVYVVTEDFVVDAGDVLDRTHNPFSPTKSQTPSPRMPSASVCGIEKATGLQLVRHAFLYANLCFVGVDPNDPPSPSPSSRGESEITRIRSDLKSINAALKAVENSRPPDDFEKSFHHKDMYSRIDEKEAKSKEKTRKKNAKAAELRLLFSYYAEMSENLKRRLTEPIERIDSTFSTTRDDVLSYVTPVIHVDVDAFYCGMKPRPLDFNFSEKDCVEMLTKGVIDPFLD